MGTDKRERKKANRAARLAAEAAAEARKKRIRTIRNVVIFVAFILVLLFVLGCSSDEQADGGPGETVAPGSSTTQPTGSTDPTTGDDGPQVPDGSTPPDYGTTPCPPAEGTDEPVIDFTDSFQQCIDPAKTYTATFETTHGTVVVELDAAGLPITTNNFVALARSGYYDGTDLFRVVTSMGIIQGGSPHTQSNTDPGPGYTIPDEGPLATTDDYGAGTLAMARTPAPDSASAQFFFLGSEDGRYLGDPNQPGGGTYRVFGKTVEGLDVLERILALGNDSDGATSEQITVESVTITES